VRTSCCSDTAAGGAHWDDLLDDDIDAKEASPRCWTYDLEALDAEEDGERGDGWERLAIVRVHLCMLVHACSQGA